MGVFFSPIDIDWYAMNKSNITNIASLNKRISPSIWTKFGVIICIIPLVVTFLYNVHLFDLNFIPSGDLLCYFGTCIAIAGSLYVFHVEQSLQKAKDIEQQRPRVSVDVSIGAKPILLVTVSNVGCQTISDIFIFDTCVKSHLVPRDAFTVQMTFEHHECIGVISVSDFKDQVTFYDGLPSEIWFTLFDESNRPWLCTAKRIIQNGPICYTCEVERNDD